jgi:hypothetical protein
VRGSSVVCVGTCARARVDVRARARMNNGFSQAVQLWQAGSLGLAAVARVHVACRPAWHKADILATSSVWQPRWGSVLKSFRCTIGTRTAQKRCVLARCHRSRRQSRHVDAQLQVPPWCVADAHAPPTDSTHSSQLNFRLWPRFEDVVRPKETRGVRLSV